MYFLIEAEHKDGTVYPLGVCEQAHAESDAHPDLVLHSRPLPEGTKVNCKLLQPAVIRWRMFDLLECLDLRKKAEEFTYYVLRVGKRTVSVISASTQEDAEEVAGKVNSLLPDGVSVAPHFFSVGPASDYPEAFGGSPVLLAARIQQFLRGE